MNPADEKHIEELFELALDQAPENQAAFLDERCVGRPEVRAKVERLLQLDDGGLETALPTPMYWSGDRVPSTDDGPAPERIGRYEIVRRIGEGGMGTVYEATQDHPRRAVALKVIRPGYATRDMIRRFRHEADILGHLQHPGIAQVYEAGVALRSDGAGAHGQPFFAMELVRGEPLQDFARKNNLGTRQRMELLARICDAVEHAHQKGVIHRDLKPSNVLVTPEGQPKILDFGVARATNSDLQTATMQTAVGQLIGTIPYMSPEQVAGDSRQLDTRSDVYALGVMLYELLSDRLPHDVRHRSIPEAARIIQEDEPSRLSSFDTSLRGDIETIVAKALDKDRERRYASVSALAADLRRYLQDEPILARPSSAVYQLRKFARRNRVLVGGLLATFVALTGGIIGTSMQAIRARQAEADAEARADAETELRAEAQLQADRAKANSDFLLWGLGFANSVAHQQGRDLTVPQMLDVASMNIGERFAARPEAEAEVRMTLGNAYFALSNYDSAYAQLLAAYELKKNLYGPKHHELIGITSNLNMVAREMQNGEMSAQRWLGESIDICLAFLKDTYPDLGITAEQFVDQLRRTPRPDEAFIARHLDALVDAHAAAMPADHPHSKPVIQVITGVWTYLWNLAGRSPELQRMGQVPLRMARKVFSRDSTDYRILLYVAVASSARAGEAQQHLELARELAESVSYYPPGHSFRAMCELMLGDALLQQGEPQDFEEAEHLIVGSCRKIARERGPRHFRTRWALSRLLALYSAPDNIHKRAEHVDLMAQTNTIVSADLVESYLRADYSEISDALGQLLDAIEHRQAENVVSIRDRLLRAAELVPPDDARLLPLADGLNRAGHLIRNRLRRPDVSLPLHRLAMNLWRRHLPEDHVKLRWGWNYVCGDQIKMGEFAQAEQSCRSGLVLSESYDAPDASTAGLLRMYLGRALWGQQRYEEAMPLAQAGFEILLAGEGAESPNTSRAFAFAVELFIDASRPDLIAAPAQSILAQLGESKAPPGIFNDAAWTIVSRPEFERDLYTLALELAQRSVEPSSENGALLNTLGVAQYRAGRHERAVETLTRSDALYVESGRPEQPANWAFIAMSQQQLGHKQEARTALTKLHELMNNAQNAASAENRQFLKEAVELIDAN